MAPRGGDKVAGTHAPHSTALAMPFIEDEWWSAENEGRMVDLSNCVQVTICHSHDKYIEITQQVVFEEKSINEQNIRCYGHT